jgi:hypothetical protein
MVDFGSEISDLEYKLNSLISDLKDGKRLQRPLEILQLAEKVVAQKSQRDEEDIELWAENLSKSIVSSLIENSEELDPNFAKTVSRYFWELV